MTDTKELLQQIAALRMRLSAGVVPARSVSEPLRAIEETVRQGAAHNRLIDSTLRSADSDLSAPATPATLRLTGRGARLLRKGRELLLALRKISDDLEFQNDECAENLQQWHRDGMAMIEVVLRTVQAMPASVSAQLRLCDGLEVILAEVGERITLLCGNLAQHKRTLARIDDLADVLRRLAAHRPVRMAPLQELSGSLVNEAKAGQPLRILYASPADPSRFAAAHGLNVAQVLVRLLLDDAEWHSQLPLALQAALVHDVGMTRVPPELLLTEGPLDADQRRLLEKHTVVAEDMLTALWPGGGWPVDAAVCHHERNDGTGYPLGRPDIQIPSFVRLIAVCDVYAALCAPRPHRPAFDTRTAMTEVLLLAERDYLDKTCAERLLLLSFYPVGTTVELNDGAIGRVIDTHKSALGLSHPDRPIVQLTTDANGQPLAWPFIIDLLQHKDRSILRTCVERD